MGAYDDVNMEGELSDSAVAEDPSQDVDENIGTTDPAQQQQATQQPVDQQQSTQPTWNGQEWGLKYRGQPYQPKSREELIALAQKGFSYSQEMERINRERQEYQQNIQRMQSQYSQYDEFDKLLKSNPALAERIMQVAQEFQGQQGQSSAPGSVDQHLYGELTTRLQQLEAQNSERINAEYDRKLADTLSNLRKQYPNHDWDFDDGNGNLERQLLQFAYDNGITNLDYAYRAMMFDQNGVNAKADALKNAAASKQQATKAGVIQKTTSAGMATTRQGYRYGDTYSDLAKRMASEIKT